MLLRALAFCRLLSALFAGCLSVSIFGAVARTRPEPTRWVAKTFIGGPQCVARGPASSFTAPGFEAEQEKLGAIGVKVQRAYYRDLPTCQACDVCPRYRREIYFEIRAIDAQRSSRAGYNGTAAPDAAELLEYERGKVYHLPRDLPGNE